MGAPARHHNHFNGRSARKAPLPAPAIDLQHFGKSAPFSLGIHIIDDGATTPGDGLSEELQYCFPKSQGIRRLMGREQRMQLYPEQSFIGINISHSGCHSLIEKKCLQGLLRFLTLGQKNLSRRGF
jgi:hypothetical protein